MPLLVSLGDLRDIVVIVWGIISAVFFFIAIIVALMIGFSVKGLLKKVRELLDDNVKPTLDSVKEAADTVRGTTEFVGQDRGRTRHEGLRHHGWREERPQHPRQVPGQVTMRLGFILGFLLGGGIASLLARSQEDAVEVMQTDSNEAAGRTSAVVRRLKQHVDDAKEAAREAQLEKEAEMRRIYDDMVHRKPRAGD